jgi:hypothetical protein
LAPSSTPVSASNEMVAACPTLIEVMSDSLKETVIVIVLELISWANPELELELELDDPRLEAATAPAKPPLPELDEVVELVPVLAVPLVETDSPGDAFDSDAIVPLDGA